MWAVAGSIKRMISGFYRNLLAHNILRKEPTGNPQIYSSTACDAVLREPNAINKWAPPFSRTAKMRLKCSKSDGTAPGAKCVWQNIRNDEALTWTYLLRNNEIRMLTADLFTYYGVRRFDLLRNYAKRNVLWNGFFEKCCPSATYRMISEIWIQPAFHPLWVWRDVQSTNKSYQCREKQVLHKAIFRNPPSSFLQSSVSLFRNEHSYTCRYRFYKQLQMNPHKYLYKGIFIKQLQYIS